MTKAGIKNQKSRSSTHLKTRALIRHNLDIQQEAVDKLNEMAPRLQQKKRKPFIEAILHGLLDRVDAESLITEYLFPTKKTSDAKKL